MKKSLKCLSILLACSVYVYGNPVSQPVYQNPQYISAQQTVPVYTFKPSQPESQGLQYNIQPQIQSVRPQYVRAQSPAVTPVYETSKEGLQNYGRQSPSALQQVCVDRGSVLLVVVFLEFKNCILLKIHGNYSTSKLFVDRKAI